MSFKHLTDGDSFVLPANAVWVMKCCGCGLVHTIALKALKRGTRLTVFRGQAFPNAVPHHAKVKHAGRK